MTNVTEKFVETADSFVESVEGVLDKARARLVHSGDRIAHAAPIEKARAGVRAVDDFAHHSPWAVVGGVAAVALAIGLLLRRH